MMWTRSSIFILLLASISCATVQIDTCLIGRFKNSNKFPVVLVRFESPIEEVSAVPVNRGSQYKWCRQLRDDFIRDFPDAYFWCTRMER